MRNLLIMAAIAASTLTAHADEFSYKGVRLGDSTEVVREKLPAYECSGSSCTYSMRRCVGKSSRSACDAGTSFAGQWVEFGLIMLRDQKVSRIYLETPKGYMPGVADAVTQAYADPVSNEVLEVKTKGGASHQSWRKSWTKGDEMLTLNAIGPNINTGSIMLSSKQEEQAAAAERQEKAKTGAKDF